jgi:hypothetical protein
MVALPGDEFNFDNLDIENAFDDQTLFFLDNPVGTGEPAMLNFQPNLMQSFLQDFGLSSEQVPSDSATGIQTQHRETSSNPALNASSFIDPVLLAQEPQHMQTIDLTLDATPGLTAVPGANGFTPMAPFVYGSQMPPMYPDPSAMQPPAPYFVPANYQGYQGYQQHYPGPFVPYAAQPMAQTNGLPAPLLNKRSHPDSDSESDVPVNKRARAVQQAQNDSDSDSDSDSNKVTKPTRARKHGGGRTKSGDTGVSSSSSSSLDLATRQSISLIGQKPEKCEDKPWVRVNSNTKGETSRTARINGEAKKARKYKSKPLPHGNWESRKYTFEYSSHSGLDEFRVKKMSPRQIMEYIMEYPSDDLTIWLQVSPADMARRYGSPGHSKCLFRDCPKHVYGDSGTIDVGHYRIAFDEKFSTYGNKVVDPFDCTGYVHLYCLERFCDFASICQSANVKVDTRVDLPREATQAKWTMSGRPETDLAQYFIKACRQDKLRQTDNFKDYPEHVSSSTPKNFEHTLAHALADINVQNRTRSQMRQFLARKLTPNVFMINKGDMEIAMTQKKIKKTKAYRKATRNKRAAEFDFEAHYDEYDPVINARIADFMLLKAELDEEDANGRPKRSKAKAKGAPARKRKRGYRNDSSDESSDSEPELHEDSASDIDEPVAYGKRTHTRTSPRKQARIDYATDEAPASTIEYNGQLYARPAPAPAPTFTPRNRLPSLPPLPSELDYAPPTPRNTSLIGRLSPGGNTLDLTNWPRPPMAAKEPPVTSEEVDALIKNYQHRLERRKSSTLSVGPMGRSPRKASFNVQPVSQHKVFDTNAPPNQLASPRRSRRLASRSSGSSVDYSME